MGDRERPSTENPNPTRVAVRGAIPIVAVVVVLLGLDAFRPPVVPAEESLEQFSAARAFTTVEKIARAPHPTGHPESDRVRAELVSDLEELGLEVAVHETTVVGHAGYPELHPKSFPHGVVEGVRVRNIVARRRGTAAGGTASNPPRDSQDSQDQNENTLDLVSPPAILLAAHYDTRAGAPGAADDSSGVAIILETLRALRVSEAAGQEKLERDLIVLFSDAEELGLYGARGFVIDHPFAAECAVAINLEARGNRGASRMFETSAGNAEWIEALARSTRQPGARGMVGADSLSASIYRVLPRDTDLTIFRGAGMAGYNFAFIRGIEHYHTPLDRPEFLDLGSVQEQGTAVLALVRTLGRGTLPETGEEDAVYFPFAGRLIHFSSATSTGISIVAVLLALVALAQAVVRRAVRIGSLLRASVGGALLAATATFLSLVASRILLDVYHDEAAHPSLFEASGSAILLVLVAMGSALGVSGWVSLRKSGLRRAELIGAGVLSWSAVTIGLELGLPNAAYLGSLPLFGIALVLLGQDAKGNRGAGGRALSLGALPALAVWPRTVDGLGVAFGATAAPAIVFCLALLLPLVAPLLAEVPRALRSRHGWLFPIAVLGMVAVTMSLEYDADLPRAGSIHYAYDTNTETALWVSLDREPGGFEKQFLGESPAREPFPLESIADPPRRAWVRSAAGKPLAGPRFIVAGEFESEAGVGEDRIGVSDSGEEWVWRRVAVTLPPGSARFDLVSEDRLAEVRLLEGKEWQLVGKRVGRFRLHAPRERLEFRIRTRGHRPLELQGIVMRYGLPETEGWTPEPRSEMEMESVGDRTYVTGSFRE